MTLSPSLVIGLPLATAAVLIAVLDRIPKRIVQWATIAVAAATLAGTIVLLLEVTRHGTIVVWVGGWHPGNRVGLGVALAIDVASGCIGILIGTVVLAAVVFSYQYFESVGTIFYVLILAMLAGMLAFTYAADIFDLFVWYEVFSIGAYALATYQGESKSAYDGALQFALTNSVAGLFFLVGNALLEGRTGELNLVAIGHSLASHRHADVLVTTAFAGIAIGLFTRGALAPLHFWFDEVHAAAPAPLSAILSGAMAPLALYGFARIYWATFATILPRSGSLQLIVVGFGALSALYGTAMTLRESRFKHKLAHATVAHSGVALCALGAFTTRGVAGAAIYEASYASAAAALFFAIAILRSRTNEYDVKLLTGAGRALPVTKITFAIATLVLCGLWTSTRVVADAGSPHADAIVSVLAIIVSAGTGGAFAAAFVRIFLWKPIGVRVKTSGPPWFLLVPSLGLAIFATLIAVVPGGLQLAARSAALVTSPAVYARSLMNGTVTATVNLAVPHASIVTWLGPLGAVLIAVTGLSKARGLRRLRIALARNPVYTFFYMLDDGDSGIYIAWIAATAVVLAFALSLVV